LLAVELTIWLVWLIFYQAGFTSQSGWKVAVSIPWWKGARRKQVL